MSNLTETLNNFLPISLKEMDTVKLLNRTDTKFIFNKIELECILKFINSDYKILTINDKKFASYRTLYFDTEDFIFYMNHHNKKENRYKVRMRKYIDSALCFLEVKNKRKGRTDKKRIKISDFENALNEDSISFINNIIPDNLKLQKTIWNNFDRITLVSQERKERLTIDFNLSFEIDENKSKISNLVICELKQEKAVRNSPIHSALKYYRIRPTRVSKYCVGIGLLYNNIKKNRFKEKHLKINKLNKQTI